MNLKIIAKQVNSKIKVYKNWKKKQQICKNKKNKIKNKYQKYLTLMINL